MATTCPSCGKDNPAATDPCDLAAVPAAGDWSLCAGCGGLAVFTGVGNEVRRPTDAELVLAARDGVLRGYRAALQAAKQQAAHQ